MNIFKILDKNGLSPTVEFKHLITLFNESHDFSGKNKCYHFKNFVDNLWPDLPVKIRRTYINFDEMLFELKLDESHCSRVNWEKLFLLCELLKNIISSVKPYIWPGNENANNCVKQIQSNMDYILDQSNHKWTKTKEGYIIVKKNSATAEAIDSLEAGNDNLAINMLEYDRMLQKGNLQRKREILANMAGFVEPWKKEFKESIYSTLYTDARELVNKLDIRHNNSGKGEIPDYAKNWTPKEYEEWYDNTFHTLLMIFLAKKQIEIKKDLNKLKKKCG